MKGLNIKILVPLLVVVALGAVYGLVTYTRSTTLGAGRAVLPPRSALRRGASCAAANQMNARHLD